MEELASLISRYGFPMIAACCLGYFVVYIWSWVTKEIKPVLGKNRKTLVNLIDRIRMLDNDMIRLNQKVTTIIQIRGKVIEEQHERAQERIDKDLR
jgi:hypothetical protein